MLTLILQNVCPTILASPGRQGCAEQPRSGKRRWNLRPRRLHHPSSAPLDHTEVHLRSQREAECLIE